MRYAGPTRFVICGWVILSALSTTVSVSSSVLTLSRAGQVSVTVKDQMGAIVPGATVTVERYGGKYATDETGKIMIKDSGKYNVKRKAVTDDEGRYAVRLPPGIYRVTAEQTGGYLKYQGEPFLLAPGGTKTVDITLMIRAADVITIP